jgi:hypothetical protein
MNGFANALLNASICNFQKGKILFKNYTIYTMIRFFFLQNKQGKTRLSKWWVTAPEDSERVKLESDVHRTV